MPGTLLVAIFLVVQGFEFAPEVILVVVRGVRGRRGLGPGRTGFLRDALVRLGRYLDRLFLHGGRRLRSALGFACRGLGQIPELEAVLTFRTGGHDRLGRQLGFVDIASESAVGTDDIHDGCTLLLGKG
jgi:hypothetical protein